MKTNGKLSIQTPNGVDTYELTLTSSNKGAVLNNNDAIAKVLRANIDKLAKEKKNLSIELSKLKKTTSKADAERKFFIYALAVMVIINFILILT